MKTIGFEILASLKQQRRFHGIKNPITAKIMTIVSDDTADAITTCRDMCCLLGIFLVGSSSEIREIEMNSSILKNGFCSSM